MDLLVNGCSYTAIWPLSDNFVQALGCNNVKNIAMHGGSFQRTCRTTIEYFAKNTKPKFVLIPVTFSHRWELAVGNLNDDLEGNWLPMRTDNNLQQEQMAQNVSKERIDGLVDNYYGCIPDNITFIDKMFTDIIMLCAFLEGQGVDYMLFDMCNSFDRRDLENVNSLDKLSMIKQNKKVIDLFEFCGNSFMWSTLTSQQQSICNPTTHHHASLAYHLLERHIIKTFL